MSFTSVMLRVAEGSIFLCILKDYGSPFKSNLERLWLCPEGRFLDINSSHQRDCRFFFESICSGGLSLKLEYKFLLHMPVSLIKSLDKGNLGLFLWPEA